MEQHFKDFSGRTIALWGLAFKPRTDDMREAPAIPIIEQLLKKGATVKAYDPAAAPVARRLFDGRIALCDKSYDALAGADALAIVTEWNEFREPDFRKMRTLMKAPVIFDGRTIYSPEQMQALGLHYFSIGRGGTRCARHRWRRLHRQPCGQGTAPRRLSRRRLRQPGCRPPWRGQ